ncbi:MAG: aminotransferase class V-fold PLP-dependent enzyme [Exilibacterium sp.]
MPANFDSAVFKSQFPLFSQPENRDLVYLDNAATTQKPQVVIDAVCRFYTTVNANAHRSSHRLARSATAMLERTRQKAAQFLGAASADEIVFTRGTTEALNLLASSLGQLLRPGDEVVLSSAEHHANLVPWQMAAERFDLKLVYIPQRNGVPAFERIGECLTERTRVVSITAASNVLGFVVDFTAVQQTLHNRPVHLVVDAAQLAAHCPIDVAALGCDFLVCSAHKFYGPSGVGLLYGRRSHLEMLPPWQGGGEMIEDVTLNASHYALAPHRFEAGTSSLASIAGLEACLDFWQQLDRGALQVYERDLIRYLHRCLEAQPRLRVLSQPENNLGIAAFTPASESDLAAADLAHWLDERDIAVRIGHLCAQPLARALQTEALVRVSVAAYNSRGDIDRLVEAISAMPAAAASEWLRGSATQVAGGAATDLFLLDDFSGLHCAAILGRQNHWQQRYKELLKWGDYIHPKPDLRQPNWLVRGCESPAWLAHRVVDNRHQFAVDSDSRIVRGLSVLLLSMINDRDTEILRVLDVEAEFATLGLDKYLSPSRSNGFRALLRRARYFVDRSQGISHQGL